MVCSNLVLLHTGSNWGMILETFFTFFIYKHRKDADQTVHPQLFRIIAVYSVIVIIFSTSYILNFKLLVVPCSAVV